MMLSVKFCKFDFVRRVRDRMPLAEIRKDLPFIYFITPTYRRPTQKADLVRLAQTLGMLMGYFLQVNISTTKFIHFYDFKIG